MDLSSQSCVSCGTPLAGEYCHVCGEQRSAGRDLSLHALLRAAASAVLDLDARGYRTLRALVTRPGFLTAQFVGGVRKAWLSPIQLFLSVNILYFIYHSFFGATPFTTPLSSQLDGQLYSGLARRLFDTHFAGLDAAGYRAYEQEFNAASATYAKSLVIIMAPLIASVLALLRLRRREAFGQHLVFGLHLLTVLLLVLMLQVIPFFLAQWLTLHLGSRAAAQALDSDAFVTSMTLALLLPYLLLGFRRAYGATWTGATVQALILGVLLLPVLHAYRLALFLLVFYTV